MNSFTTVFLIFKYFFSSKLLISEAGGAGLKRAIAAGARAPLLLVQGSMPSGDSKQAGLAALLGAMAAAYVPLEMRESVKERKDVN